MIEYVFRINKKVIDMEHPNRNSEETIKIFAEMNDLFQDDGHGEFVFKLIEGKQKESVLEYDKNYLVKNEHKGYNHTTKLKIGIPKQVTSMWGKNHITLTITYLGIEGVPEDSSNNSSEDSESNNQPEDNQFSDQEGINKFVNSEN